ncbi:MAG: S49 family peptidase [Methylibium sp.]
MKREALVAEIVSTPWALPPDRLAVMAGVVARWYSGTPRAMDDEDYGRQKTAYEMRREQAARMSAGGVAVVSCYGVIVQRAGMMTEWCGGTSTQQLTAWLRELERDEAVQQILMDYDTPGGSVYGVAEAGAEIRRIKAVKPIVGISNSLCASAGYWLGSQCSEFYITPGGEAGSIGVYQMFQSWAKYMEELGVDTKFLSAGKYKVEGNPYQPLSEDAEAFLVSRVKEYYDEFVSAVAKGRGVSVEAVRNGMGQGRVLGAQACVAEKMADGVMTFEEVMRKMQRSIKTGTNAPRSRLNSAQRDIDILT